MKKTLLFVLAFISLCSNAQLVVSWTEQGGDLALGYPVPIPVDTTEPFDGFRTYNGLFTKHQSMALNNDYITGHIVGQTIYDRGIWAYVLSDDNDLTKYGVKEGAMLINGNIHAREWQSPEVLTGIIELLDENSQDQSLHQFLLENTAIVALPVNNVDGFLQTQRFPDTNYIGTDPDSPSFLRDGRMRRKNMHNVDEVLSTFSDHLLGVDLNRNNNPYWATSPRSSSDPTSQVYHGLFVNSEPETLARLAAAELVEAGQVRIYTDVHSYSAVHFSVRTNNANRNALQASLLRDFTTHHKAFPAARNYIDTPSGPGGGIGSTDEYFALTYEVPSWTLEIEPNISQGEDYGGFFVDGSGFILPESEITRVREQLAQTFMVAWYGQAGPPSITQVRIMHINSRAIVYDAQWDIQSDGSRLLIENSFDTILTGEDYSLIISFDKPMRIRNSEGDSVHLQGQPTNNISFPLNPAIDALLSDQGVFSSGVSNGRWIDEKTSDALSYKHYKDDTFAWDLMDINFTSAPGAIGTDEETLPVNFIVQVADMIGQKLDANPGTTITWANGQWQGYDDGVTTNTISGGVDSSYTVTLGSPLSTFSPLIQPTGLYYDPERSGEGFSYELLDPDRVWIQWFTYDELGNQRWYSGVGEFSGNVIKVNQLNQIAGGVFGEGFDSGNIVVSSFGSLEIVFSGGEARAEPIGFHQVERTAKVVYTDVNGKKLRTNLHQLSLVKGALSAGFAPTIVFEEPVGLITGSWYDPARSGEGYILEILEDGRAILIWYTYDNDGNHMWLIDSNGVVTQDGNNITLDFNNVVVTNGPVFGEDYNPANVVNTSWGEVHMQLTCSGSGTVNYSSTIEGFDEGQYNISKLTHPWVLPYICDEE
jgi:hypothetical protein